MRGYWSSSKAVKRRRTIVASRQVIETARLVFCTWDEANPAELVELCTDSGLRQFGSPTYSDMTLESAREFMAEQAASFLKHRTGKFAVYCKATGELTGISGLFEMDPPFEHELELNYRLRQRYWGQGLGVEMGRAVIRYAFETLGRKRLRASVAHANIRSQHVLQILGMAFETISPFDAQEQIWIIVAPPSPP